MKTLLLLCFFSVGYSQKLPAQDSFKKALEQFHQVLAFTYHPMADDSNFVPIHNRSGELATVAEKVEKTLDSSKDNNTKLENAVEQLAEECKALNDIIEKEAADESIRIRLTEIHTKFHEIDDMVSSMEK